MLIEVSVVQKQLVYSSRIGKYKGRGYLEEPVVDETVTLKHM